MPSWRSSQFPHKASVTRISAAISGERIAIVLLSCSVNPCVAARKAGTRPTGSTTSNSVTKADIAKSTKAHLPVGQKHAAKHGVNFHQALGCSFAGKKVDRCRGSTD